MSIRVVVVDDNDTVRLTLSRGFASQPDLEVVGEASDGDGAADLLACVKPDVIVMDVHMPRLSGVDATAQLRALGIDTPVVILTADSSLALPPGATSLLVKSRTTMAQTIDAVRRAAG